MKHLHMKDFLFFFLVCRAVFRESWNLCSDMFYFFLNLYPLFLVLPMRTTDMSSPSLPLYQVLFQIAKIPLSLLCFMLKCPSSLSLSLYCRCSSCFYTFVGLQWIYSSKVHAFLGLREPELSPALPELVWSVPSRRKTTKRTTFLYLLVTHFRIQPEKMLVTFAIQMHWLVYDILVSLFIPRFFSAELL